MQHIDDFAFSTFQQSYNRPPHSNIHIIDPHHSGIGLKVFIKYYCTKMTRTASLLFLFTATYLFPFEQRLSYSTIRYHVSCIMYHVACIMYHVSCIMYHVSCIMYHVSCIMYHVSCIMYHVSCIIYHVYILLYVYKSSLQKIYDWTSLT